MAQDSFGIGDTVKISLEDAIARLEQSPLHQLHPYANSQSRGAGPDTPGSETAETDDVASAVATLRKFSTVGKANILAIAGSMVCMALIASAIPV